MVIYSTHQSKKMNMNHNPTPNWHLTLPEAMKIQSNCIGVDLIQEELSELKSFDDIKKNTRLTEDFQLNIEFYDNEILNLPTPSIILIKSDNDDCSYAVITDINTANKSISLASINFGEVITLNESELNLSKIGPALTLRKSVERIYLEQSIPTDKKHWFWSIFSLEKVFLRKYLSPRYLLISLH